MARASGRLRFSADTTSRPLPSPSRRSTTAKAGAALPICARPSETLSQEVTVKPRVSIARDRRSRNGLSSSTISSERSAWPVSSAMAFTVQVPLWRTFHIWRDNTALPRPHQAVQAPVWPLRAVLGFRFGGYFASLEASAWPGDLNHGAMIRKDPVGEGDLGAGALQQRAGDKYPETEAVMLARGFLRAAPPRQIGLADALQQVGGDPGTIVGNHDLDGIG